MEDKTTETTVQNSQNPQCGQTIIVNASATAKTNGLGIAGFILALLGVIFCWVPVLGWILWFLGFLFSLIGVFKKPRAMAIVGLSLSFMGIILLILLTAGLMAAFA